MPMVNVYLSTHDVVKFNPFISKWMDKILETLRVTIKSLNDPNPFFYFENI